MHELSNLPEETENKQNKKNRQFESSAYDQLSPVRQWIRGNTTLIRRLRYILIY